MPRVNTALLAFNRGVISPLGLARVDLERLQFSAETQTNWIPRVLGSMMLRPGLKYIYELPGKSVHIPFIASSEDVAIIELSDELMRVSVNDALIERESVTASVTNGTFTIDLASWTDNDQAGAASQWATGGYMSLLGTGSNEARRAQLITVNEANTQHALRISIARGPVVLRVGTTSGDDSYAYAVLKTGIHSIAFTPTGNFYIEFSNILTYSTLVDFISIENGGILQIPAPWVEDDLYLIRRAQSADVVYIACDGYQQYRIERRDNDSWSVVKEEPLDGPFGEINTSTITLTPSALTGDITLTASRALFTGSASEHSGELFRISSQGQVVQASVNAEDNYTGSILVTGVGSSREFSYSIAGTWTATVTLQRSVDGATWEDVATYTANASSTFNDGLDNVEYFYRIGIKTGNYTSGTALLGLSFSGGTLTGVVKIRRVSSSTSATATVIQPLGGTSATSDWYRGQWSDERGFPTAVSLYELRMWYAGRGKIWGSVTDDFSSFDDEVIGDSGPIIRNIGEGPVDTIHWLAPLQRMIIGTTGSEISARSTSFDEPLTPTNFNVKDASTKGSANVDIAKDGTRCIFVQRSGSRVYQMQYSLESNDYTAVNLSELAPEITEPSIIRLGIQNAPDTRIHCVRSDGKVAILIKDEAENTLAWVLFETDGEVEDVVILPGDVEDQVYYAVKRTIDGSNVRYLEKWALESEGRGGTTNKLADSFIYQTGVSLSTITGLDHLEGESVVLWGNGKDLGTYTVSSGSITPSETVTSYCVGLPYNATFKSTKLAYAAGMGTALNQVKKVLNLGMVARDIYPGAITYGPSDSEQFDMLDFNNHMPVTPDTVIDEYDFEMSPFGGHWDADARVVIEGSAPRPATLLALTIGIQTNDKA